MSNIETSRGEAAAAAAIAHIESLAARFEKAEKHINDDMEQIEKELKQLIDLIRTVSTIQQQVGNQQRVLTDVRDEVRGKLSQLETLISGSDARYVENLRVIGRKITDAMGEQNTWRKKLEERVSGIDNRLRTWLNRGIGGWAVFALIVGTLQYAGLQYVNNIQVERDAAAANVERLKSRVIELEQRQQFIERSHHAKPADGSPSQEVPK